MTLKEHGELRGCIGYITPIKSLAETVRDVAAYAALEDSRFTPVTTQELPLLEYEISVMSPLRRVLNIKEIKVGKHGLIMKQGDIEGILLAAGPRGRTLGPRHVPRRDLPEGRPAARRVEGR